MNNLNIHPFGYPMKCTLCRQHSDTKPELRVIPYYHRGQQAADRIMLVGQDPTIYNDSDRVRNVLMLDDTSSQLYRWLSSIFGDINSHANSIYATNTVKCTLEKPPGKSNRSGYSFLKPFFAHCRPHLENEIHRYEPSFVVSFGEPAHMFFRSILDDPLVVPSTMKESFCGDFYSVTCNGFSFSYTPCLHIKTFRLARTYGNHLIQFGNTCQGLFK